MTGTYHANGSFVATGKVGLCFWLFVALSYQLSGVLGGVSLCVVC